MVTQGSNVYLPGFFHARTVRRELIPEVVGGATEVVTLPETLEQPQLSLMNYASEAETFMGTCPDCSSQLEFAEGCKKCHACGYSECG
jgi:ribonucleoside-diphosphate reductase alpha chain